MNSFNILPSGDHTVRVKVTQVERAEVEQIITQDRKVFELVLRSYDFETKELQLDLVPNKQPAVVELSRPVCQFLFRDDSVLELYYPEKANFKIITPIATYFREQPPKMKDLDVEQAIRHLEWQRWCLSQVFLGEA